jgi:hypothetical protein
LPNNSFELDIFYKPVPGSVPASRLLISTVRYDSWSIGALSRGSESNRGRTSRWEHQVRNARVTPAPIMCVTTFSTVFPFNRVVFGNSPTGPQDPGVPAESRQYGGVRRKELLLAAHTISETVGGKRTVRDAYILASKRE